MDRRGRVAALVVIRQPDHLDSRRDLRRDALGVGHVGVVRRVRVDVEIRGEHVRGLGPRALEWDRERDVTAVRRQVDLAFPDLVIEAVPRPHRVATVRRRARTAGADRDGALAESEHDAVPRADHTGRVVARGRALALAVQIDRAEVNRLILREQQHARRDRCALIGDRELERRRRAGRGLAPARAQRERGEPLHVTT